jgi:[ribosomal protein S5]-alanine N-acetyltransferase
MSLAAQPPTPLPLYTPRLRLRRFVPEDFEALHRIYQDPEVMRFMGGVRTLELSRLYFDASLDHWEQHGFGALAVEPREGALGAAPLMGRVVLAHLEDTGEVELGYLFDAPYQGQGYALEAATRLLDWGFEALALPRIVAIALPGNLRSFRVMRRLGMQPDGTGYHYGYDVTRFVLTRQEWQTRRAIVQRSNVPR